MTRPAEDPEEDEETFPSDELPVDAEDLDIDLDDNDDDDDEEFDEEGEEPDAKGAEGAGTEGGDGAAKPVAGGGTTAEADGTEKREPPKKKDAKDAEPDPGDPDTKVPTKAKMLAALEWAFASEEGVSPELLERFADHAIHVLETNKVMNLTAIQDPKEIAAKHYLDCWRVTRLVPLIAKKVLDLGTGAGFPGLPVALAEPNLSMTLCDSTRKKVQFLEDSIQKLSAKNVRAVWDRAEEYLTKERVDIVVVRAVSSVRENIRTLRKVRHSLQDMVMLKGNSWSREVRAAEREAERLGFKLDTVWEHELPEEMGSRAILVYRAPGGAGF